MRTETGSGKGVDGLWIRQWRLRIKDQVTIFMEDGSNIDMHAIWFQAKISMDHRSGIGMHVIWLRKIYSWKMGQNWYAGNMDQAMMLKEDGTDNDVHGNWIRK
ncbi:hypothetical protein ACJMK2_008218 [Sinanodonta woodiana]|uniref:Uncharacterized protein n=1 Tax=Sinanodonta woodiana TaxID=1069815 RepID=A0ABD3VKX6_SINWO